jgi:hypothetical protein
MTPGSTLPSCSHAVRSTVDHNLDDALDVQRFWRLYRRALIETEGVLHGVSVAKLAYPPSFRPTVQTAPIIYHPLVLPCAAWDMVHCQHISGPLTDSLEPSLSAAGPRSYCRTPVNDWKPGVENGPDSVVDVVKLANTELYRTYSY